MALSKIKTASIADDAVTSAKVATGGIATIDMADGSVTSLKIADGAISPSDLSTGSPTWNSSGQVMIGGANATYATYPKLLVANTSVDIQGVIDGSADSSASSVRNLVSLRAPFGPSPASTSNAGAKWGIVFSGRPAADSNYPLGSTEATTTSLGKSAAIYGYSDETNSGYNRAIGLQFWTSNEIDGNMVERMRINRQGNISLNGAAPPIWVGDSKFIEFPQGSIYTVNSAQVIGLVANAYNSSGWKYTGNGYAPRMELSAANGSVGWAIPTAVNSSGAGTSISYTSTMSLDYTGTLTVVNGVIAKKNTSVNDGGASAAFKKADGSGGMWIGPSIGGGQYNSLHQAGDAVIVSGVQYGPMALSVHDGATVRLSQTDIKFGVSNTLKATLTSNGLSVSGKVYTNDNVSGPIFFIDRTNRYDDVSAGSYFNLQQPGNGSTWASYWHYGTVINNNQSGDSMSFNKFRLIVQAKPTSSGAMALRVGSYFYASGWSTKGVDFGTSNIDTERGYLMYVSPWINLGDMEGWGDVPGLGIYCGNSTRLGPVHIQYSN